MTLQQRQARWEALKLAIGHSSVVMDMAFGSSLRYWQTGELGWTDQWTVEEAGDLLSPVVHSEKAAVLIKGDCQAHLSLSDGGLVHVYGDLADRITVAANCNIVIGGKILQGAGIEAEGITHIFVGGDVDGFVRSAGSMKVSVHGNMNGMIGTGHPSIRLRVQGNFSGQMQPTKKASLAFLEVRGFMPFSALESIAQHGYTHFDATVAVSDRNPGIYPEPVEYKRLVQQRSYCSWVILAST
jgi:cytoskeletal protein CcmA (bactofilin family)